ncbi:MAG: threonine synthase [Firmicutes bacterium]|nr:threonine synthase [Bacillota bacterium]
MVNKVKYVKQYCCTVCHKTFPKESKHLTCPDCGELGILDIEFDYEEMKKEVNKEYFIHNQRRDIFRYLPFLPIEGKYIDKTLKVGWTPLYRSNKIEEERGAGPLYFKDDGANPTSSLKDRASVLAVCKAMEEGFTTIACSSTGNAASSLAGNAARLGLNTVIFVPKRAPAGKLAQLKAYGANLIVVDGNYKDTFLLSKLAIEEFGWYNRNAAINPLMVEGKKTVALEIAEQLDFEVPDWVVSSVGDGCTIAGVYKGFYDLFMLGLIKKIPRLLGVQSVGCNPFVKSFEYHEPIHEQEENTIADSISVGIPRNPVKAMDAVTNTLGCFLSVKDEDILSAMKILGSKEGLFAEPAAAASLAGYFKAFDNGVITKQDVTCVIITGNGLKDTTTALSAFKDTRYVKATLEDLKKYMKEMIGE